MLDQQSQGLSLCGDLLEQLYAMLIVTAFTMRYGTVKIQRSRLRRVSTTKNTLNLKSSAYLPEFLTTRRSL